MRSVPSAGSVEHHTGTTELKKLGGLSKDMLLAAFGVFNKLPLVNFIRPILEGYIEAGEK